MGNPITVNLSELEATGGPTVPLEELESTQPKSKPKTPPVTFDSLYARPNAPARTENPFGISTTPTVAQPSPSEVARRVTQPQLNLAPPEHPQPQSDYWTKEYAARQRDIAKINQAEESRRYREQQSQERQAESGKPGFEARLMQSGLEPGTALGSVLAQQTPKEPTPQYESDYFKHRAAEAEAQGKSVWDAFPHSITEALVRSAPMNRNMPVEQARRISEPFTQPLLDVPTATGHTDQPFVAGMERAIGGFSSPENLALLGTLGELEAAAQSSTGLLRQSPRVVSGLFATQMGAGLVQSARDYQAAKAAGDTQAVQRILGSALVQAPLALLTAYHASVGRAGAPMKAEELVDHVHAADTAARMSESGSVAPVERERPGTAAMAPETVSVPLEELKPARPARGAGGVPRSTSLFPELEQEARPGAPAAQPPSSAEVLRRAVANESLPQAVRDAASAELQRVTALRPGEVAAKPRFEVTPPEPRTLEKAEATPYQRQQAQLYVNRVRDLYTREYAQRYLQANLEGTVEPTRGNLSPLQAAAIRSSIDDNLAKQSRVPVAEKYPADVLEEAQTELRAAHDLASSFERPGRYFAAVGQTDEPFIREEPKAGIRHGGIWRGVSSARNTIADQFPWYSEESITPGNLADAATRGKGANYERIVDRIADHIQAQREEVAPILEEFRPQLESLAAQVRDMDPDLSQSLLDIRSGRYSSIRNLREYIAGKVQDASAAAQFSNVFDQLASEEARDAVSESVSETAPAYGGAREAGGGEETPRRELAPLEVPLTDLGPLPEPQPINPREVEELQEKLGPGRVVTPDRVNQILADRAVEKNIEQGLAGNRRDEVGEIREEHRAKLNAERVLPGMENAVEEQRQAAGREQARQAGEEFNRPRGDIEAIAGRMERESPLFRGTEASPQKEIFAEKPAGEKPTAQPLSNRAKATRVREAKGPSNDEIIAEAYRPGSVVKSYGYGQYDKVIEFTPRDAQGHWQVKVIASDKEGNPLPGERERTHSTPPERADAIAARQRLEVAKATPREEVARGPEHDYENVGKHLGIEYRGVMGADMGLGDKAVVIYQDPESKTSIGVKVGEWSPERLQEKLQDARARMAADPMGGAMYGGLGFLDPELIRRVMPESIKNALGENLSLGEREAGIVREKSGELARKKEQVFQQYADAMARWEKRPIQDGRDFILREQHGERQPNAQDQAVADQLQKEFASRRSAVEDLTHGSFDHWRENYFPQMWERPNQVADFMKQRILGGRRPLQGPAGFRKARVFDDLQEGLDAGFKPITDNPVSMALLKMHEMDRYIMAHQILGQSLQEGLAKFVRFGEQPPAGWTRVQDSMFRVMHYSEEAKGIVIRGEYYMPAEAARILNNYLAPGLRGNPLYDVFRGAGNTLNQAQLGFSAFHAMFSALNSSISDFALALRKASRFNLLEAAQVGMRSATLLTSPVRHVIEGTKLMREYLSPGTYAKYSDLADAVAKGGGRIYQDPFYRNAALTQFWKAWKEGDWARVGLKAFPAALEKMAQPVMEHLVPRLKVGAFADIARESLDRLPPGAGKAEIRAALDRAWDSVDNRFGQVVYDNLFINKAVKDLGLISVRSLGWNLGTIRELGGGGKDLMKATGRWMTGGKPRFTDRMAYTMALPIVTGYIGALVNYAYTGQGPQELKDYFYPRTGRTLPNGEPERISIPTYMKDIYAFTKHPLVTASHKVHPLLAMVADMLRNQDFYGTEIRHPDDPLVRQVGQLSSYVGEQLSPISFRNVAQRGRAEGRPGVKGALREAVSPAGLQSFVGITPAPASVTHTAAEEKAIEILNRRAPRGTRTSEEFTRGLQHSFLRGEVAVGRMKPEDLAQRVRAGEITPKEAGDILKQSREAPIAHYTHSLPIEDFMEVWDLANQREREQLRPLLLSKRHLVANLPANERAAVAQRISEALKQADTSRSVINPGFMRSLRPEVNAEER